MKTIKIQEKYREIEKEKSIEVFIDKCIKDHSNFLIAILQEIQEYFNYLPEKLLRKVAEKLQIPLIDVHGVATFYQSLSLVPKGEHIITVCLGTACYVRGGEELADVLSRELNVEFGESTEDMEFTLETVNCLGCCAIGPVVVIDSEYYDEVTPQKIVKILKTLKEGKK
ncbi:MAG: NADH-quinone oxidoreductase subunit NuoE [Candidatus Helarchaeota archaeon]|nr:NADH-quinone oxidoreductase subunit NuoE [Candidatus Helarchaeota archaeon]